MSGHLGNYEQFITQGSDGNIRLGHMSLNEDKYYHFVYWFQVDQFGMRIA